MNRKPTAADMETAPNTSPAGEIPAHRVIVTAPSPPEIIIMSNRRNKSSTRKRARSATSAERENRRRDNIVAFAKKYLENGGLDMHLETAPPEMPDNMYGINVTALLHEMHEARGKNLSPQEMFEQCILFETLVLHQLHEKGYVLAFATLHSVVSKEERALSSRLPNTSAPAGVM